MTKPNIAVIYFPGNNCEVETLEAVKAAGMDGKILRWNTKEYLSDFDGYVIPGGWAYEDRIRAGVIAAKDPVMNIIKEESRKGKPVLGICNGAQVLVETGMVPGLKDKVEFALAPNKNPFVSGYYNVWVNIKSIQNKKRAAFTDLDKNEVLKLPIAHGEGRFVTKDKALVKQLIKNKQIIFQYCNEEGKIEDKFPTNPNGSMLNIAAICSKEGNIMAMMPHPERAIWKRQIPGSKKTDQKTNNIRIFESMKRYIIKNK
ncbi:phosphoribosylformylglycinamidine synthase I [Candidatus Woesearchaeota archaeon]|nr:phosphoribosylformylglycinamidine synthase I [Candidatus Woesearchaeota archaeon]|tara:strand:+ start:181 stop:954 length:774 start_codon:yes stop_codon:yes gene_type:complete